ncbi:MAG: lytic transglycosylase domain-containing protein, partial [Ruminiclostridium sp.]
MRKSKRKQAVIAVIVIGLIVIAFLFGGELYRKGIYEYKKSTHPLKYSGYVEKYSEEYGVDKFLLYSVIKTESGFDTKAVSNVGARGLMQIMEETFDWIKYRLDDDETVYDDMFEAEANIRYGAYLIDYLVDYFGDVDAAAAAYHSG